MPHIPHPFGNGFLCWLSGYSFLSPPIALLSPLQGSALRPPLSLWGTLISPTVWINMFTLVTSKSMAFQSFISVTLLPIYPMGVLNPTVLSLG